MTRSGWPCRVTRAGPSRLLVFALVLISTLSAGAVAGVVAQEDPGEPVNVYGTAADEAGNPIPAGTTVNAVVDGKLADSLTVETAGEFGGPDAFDGQLAVNAGAGESMSFTIGDVNGPTALETVDLQNAGSVVAVNLTFPGETFADTADLVTLSLSLAETDIAVDGDTDATALATFEDDSKSEVTDSATVESLDPGVATVSGTTVVGESAGTATVQATYTVNGTTETDTADVTVETVSGNLTGLTLTVDTPTVANGETTAVDVTAQFSDGGETDATDSATVESLDPGVATVADGAALGVAAGTATIRATLNDGGVTVTDTAEVTVEQAAAELVGLTLLLTETTIETGETVGTSVTAQFDNGSEVAVTGAAAVESRDSTVATVVEGAVTGESAGTATVTAEYEGVSDETELTVEAAGGADFEVAVDAPATAATGETLTVTVTVTNAGDAVGTTTLTYEFGGAKTEQTLTLAAGVTESITLSAEAPDGAGEFNHTVGTADSSDTATTTVESDDPDDGTGDDGSDDDGSDGDGSSDDESDGDGTGDDGSDGDGSDGDGSSDDGSGDDGSDGDGSDGDGSDGDGSDGDGGDGNDGFGSGFGVLVVVCAVSGLLVVGHRVW